MRKIFLQFTILVALMPFLTGSNGLFLKNAVGAYLRSGDLGYLRSFLITTDGYSAGHVNTTVPRWHTLVSKNVGGAIYQVWGGWDKDGKLIFAKRTTNSQTWTIYTTALAIAEPGDGHYMISLGLDPNGYIHVSGNTHHEPLWYYKSNDPIQTFDGTLTAINTMTGANENKTTYPYFFNDANDKLYVSYRNRDGGSTDELFVKSYNEGTETWSAIAGTTGGKVARSAGGSGFTLYQQAPHIDAAGNIHMFWSWRKVGDNAWDLIYTKWNGSGFVKSDGSSQSLPVTAANAEVVRSTTLAQTISPFEMSYADSSNRPVTQYMLTVSGVVQIWVSWHDGNNWNHHQVTSYNANDANMRVATLAIDRSDDTAYFFIASPPDDIGLIAAISAPGNYESWSFVNIYPVEFGLWNPRYDYFMWRDYQVFHLPVTEFYPPSGDPDNRSIVMVEWRPR